MSYYIEINGVQNSPQQVPLVGNSGMIGSNSECQIPIAHSEVSAQALLLDVRGDDFWVQNLNSYSIYVGMDEVVPNGWSPWSADETIQLTRSVSLTIRRQTENVGASGSGKAKKADATGKGLDIGKLLQILIIVGCFIGAPLILFAEKDPVTGVIDKEFDFNAVVNDLDSKKKDIEYLSLKKYLQQAWMADRRWRKKNPTTVMKYYELLVSHRLVRENPDQDETIKAINEYAKRRLSELRFNE